MMNKFPFVKLVSITELAKTDIFVDNNKGFALRRLGMYSPNIVEQMVHSFIPINNLCVASPNTEICQYNSQLKKTNIFELNTVLSSHDTVSILSYTKDSVSKAIGNDIVRIFSQHHPDQIMDNKPGTIHFVNDQLYYQNIEEKAIPTTSENSDINNYIDIPRVRSTLAQTIIQSVNNQKIGFDHLSPNELELILSKVFSTFDSSYMYTNTQDTLNLFTELIIGQSIYGLPYCSLSEQKSSPQPCLIFSTLFIRIPVNSVSNFLVFELVPLPIVFDDQKYIYNNLPSIIGINSVDQTLVVWEKNFGSTKCTFSGIVVCQCKPISFSLSKLSCLGQLLDERQSTTSLCEINQSNDIQQDVLRISNGLWLVYNVQEVTNCQIYSDTNESPEIISIREPSILRMPCYKTIVCTNFQLPATRCQQNKVIIKSGLISNAQNVSQSIIPIKDMSRTILSSYNLQYNKSLKDFKTALKSSQSTIYETMHDLVTYIVSFICLVLITLFLYIIKLIKHKMQKELDEFDSQIQDVRHMQETIRIDMFDD